MGEITELLKAAAEGEHGSQDALFNAVYTELHRLSVANLRKERAGHTLQPTALVHEAYLRLVGGKALRFESRAHFFVTAARIMRRILIDHARSHCAAKRAGALKRVDLDEINVTVEESAEDLLTLDTALDQLAELNARQARVVELRFFSGLDMVEIAQVLGTSEKTAKRDWALARAWLEKTLRG
ncbi:MAG: sigma-70 family RNA polymerase sigma factor [Bryobacterales bacterium]|nr:sigma-70 family RNA polymerase sigma factor [Bryobacterales bacterium]